MMMTTFVYNDSIGNDDDDDGNDDDREGDSAGDDDDPNSKQRSSSSCQALMHACKSQIPMHYLVCYF